MSESKVFCEECRDEVSFNIVEKEMEGVVKGIKYSYIGKEAHCTSCGMEVYVSKINDYNLKLLYDEYRKDNELASLEIIREIPDKYAIGKRPLSLLLGWGELTFTRYYDGDIPTKQYSDILKMIYKDPLYYKNILEKNMNNLKTVSAYKKSKHAVELLLEKDSLKNTKIDLAIEYLLNQCRDITPLALQKALYYVQGFYYAFYKSFLFVEDCEAWVRGPVYSDIYYRYRDYRFDPIEGSKDFDDSVFLASEKAVLDSVVKNICCYSGKILEEFTHCEEPWLLTRGELPENVISNRVIKKEQIGNYFNLIKEKYNMVNPNDIKEYAQSMFLKI